MCCTPYTTGLADRLLGTVSAFYYALLTGRALQLQTYGAVASLEVGATVLETRKVPPVAGTLQLLHALRNFGHHE